MYLFLVTNYNSLINIDLSILLNGKYIILEC